MEQRINKKLIAVCLASLLSACASKGMKDGDTQGSSATKDAQSAMGQSSNSSSASTAGAGGAVPAATMSPFTDPNNILSQRIVFFGLDSFTIQPSYNAALKAHAQYLTSHPSAQVIIKGNADERGSREYNLSLGQKRASSVKRALNLYGVSNSQIETVSYGEEYPLEPGSYEAAWSKNRRAEIDYISE